jgi:hypothetical protein
MASPPLLHLFADYADGRIRFQANRPKAPDYPVVARGEFPQRNECIFVSHFGKRVGTPETNLFGWMLEVFTQNAMRVRAMVMRQGFRGLPSDFRVLALISKGFL